MSFKWFLLAGALVVFGGIRSIRWILGFNGMAFMGITIATNIFVRTKGRKWFMRRHQEKTEKQKKLEGELLLKGVCHIFNMNTAS